MMKELEALRVQVGRDGGSSSGDPFCKSRAAKAAAVKATAAKSKASPPMPEPNAGPPAPELPETDAAKQARLRRLCERKPSGKINVPLALHEKWLKANRDERDSMVDKLDEVGWDKDFKLFYHVEIIIIDVIHYPKIPTIDWTEILRCLVLGPLGPSYLQF